MLSQPVPGSDAATPEPSDAVALAFIKRLLSVLLGAIMPLWNDAELLSAHPR